MEQIKRLIGLRKEAVLLDSWLYILKAMLAIGTGYVFGMMFDVTRLDMISVLLGVMYNLEATNISAVKGGVNQLLASFLGAVTTGILVYFLGVNILTIMLGMGLTLYMALKIDYRAVSPVAIFTSIYMTQFIQSDAMGNPSILLTIRLRMLALGLGVLIAIIFNLIFSFFYYRKITRKRLEFVRLKLENIMSLTYDYLMDHENPEKMSYNMPFSHVFADIEIVTNNIEALKKEPLIPLNVMQKKNLKTAEEVIRRLKVMTHLAYDSCYTKDTYKVIVQEHDLMEFRKFTEELKNLDFLKTSEEDEVKYMPHLKIYPSEDSEGAMRIFETLDLLYTEFNTIVELQKKM
ncbi:hypothetical protein ACHAL6_07835 [Proteiniclasticum sp. C24MP]|uniref:hypothetical protein n=1 Tax=Proteiniclasticum sp. C24MP TaxID=3374101 RepID=UPI003753FF83